MIEIIEQNLTKEQKRTLEEWCYQNIANDVEIRKKPPDYFITDFGGNTTNDVYYVGPIIKLITYQFIFPQKSDAVLFKLTWG